MASPPSSLVFSGTCSHFVMAHGGDAARAQRSGLVESQHEASTPLFLPPHKALPAAEGPEACRWGGQWCFVCWKEADKL